MAGIKWYWTNINDEIAITADLSGKADLCFNRLRSHYISCRGNLAYDPAENRKALRYKSARPFKNAFAELVERGIVSIEDGMIKFPAADALIPPLRYPWPQETIDAVFNMTGGHCSYCDIVLTVGTLSPTQFNIDHKLPLSRGGSDDLENLAPSCRSCNLAKRASTVDEFLAKRGAV